AEEAEDALAGHRDAAGVGEGEVFPGPAADLGAAAVDREVVVGEGDAGGGAEGGARGGEQADGEDHRQRGRAVKGEGAGEGAEGSGRGWWRRSWGTTRLFFTRR